MYEATKLEWEEPWLPMDDANMASKAEAELERELAAQHNLYRLPVRAVAYRQDCDDVLFQLVDETGRFAVAHLTYAQHPENDPRWPESEIFDNFEDFKIKRYQQDVAEWI